MRLAVTVLILVAGVAISVLAYVLSGGRFVLLFLPLVLGLPFVFGRRR
jgi:hypothetical protein